MSNLSLQIVFTNLLFGIGTSAALYCLLNTGPLEENGGIAISSYVFLDSIVLHENKAQAKYTH